MDRDIYGLDDPGIEARWGEIFRTCPDRPWDPPSLLYNAYRVFPGLKQPRCGIDHPLPPTAEGKKRIELYGTPTPLLGLRGPF